MNSPTPSLHSEWQLVVCVASGAVIVLPCESEWSARSRGRKIVHATDGRATWRVEQRFCTDWRSVSVPQPVTEDKEAGMRRRSKR